jgi:nitrogen fixation/metabolism regulation signal transduction histidine kinase
MIIGYAAVFSVISSIFTGLVSILLHRQIEGGQQMTAMLPYYIAGCGTLVFTMLLMAGLVVTNRICGPIYRLQMQIRKVRNAENPSPIRLRKGDEFMDLAEEFNQMMEKLELRK